jgi:hypothetical protein
MWILYILLILVVIGIVGALSYGLYLTSEKIRYYEEFILERRNAYNQLLSKIRELDQREMFEKDEDVGIIFSDIKDEIEQFDKIIE